MKTANVSALRWLEGDQWRHEVAKRADVETLRHAQKATSLPACIASEALAEALSLPPGDAQSL
jgi:hypothetical protein